MIGSLSGYSYAPYYANQTQHTSPLFSQTKSSLQTEPVSTPVQSVAPVQKTLSNEEQFSVEALLGQHESDPVEMSVRMRIQTPTQDTAEEDAAWEPMRLPGQKDDTETELPRLLGQKEEDTETQNLLGTEEEEESAAVEEKEEDDKKSPQETMEEGECQTCAKRKYQDESDDSGVSFQMATALTPERAATAVRGHELEHVVREQAKAAREGREVISQSVTIKTGICPECGTVYTAGGTTRTVTKNATPNPALETDTAAA